MTIETSTTQTNEQICRAVIERGFNNGDLDGLEAFVAHDIVEHQEGSTSGIDGLRALITELRSLVSRTCTSRSRTPRPRATRCGSASVRPAPTTARCGVARRPAARSTSPSWTSCASPTAAWSSTGASPTGWRCSSRSARWAGVAAADAWRTQDTRVRTCLPQRLDPPESDRGSIDHPAQRAAEPGTAALVAIQARSGSRRRRRGWHDRDAGDEPHHAACEMGRPSRHAAATPDLRRIVGAAKGRAWVPESERRRGTALVHLGIGAVGGAGYALGREAIGSVSLHPLVGLGFGATLWAFNYIVAAPALDLFPPPWKDRAGRPPVMLAANALFGLVTAVLVDRADAGDRAVRRPLARPSKPSRRPLRPLCPTGCHAPGSLPTGMR